MRSSKSNPKISKKEEVAQVASISAQNEEVGSLIAEVMDMVGQDGVVTVEEGQTLGLSKEVVEGMQFDSGYISPYMVTDTSRMEAVFEKAKILITDKRFLLFKKFFHWSKHSSNRERKIL